MRIYNKLFFLGLIVLAACKGEDKVPDNVISEDRMPVIIADVHIIDGDLSTRVQMPDSMFKYGMGQYITLFKKHHTDTAQFRKSFVWYTKHPQKLDVIYDDVIKILQKKNDSVAKIKPPVAKPVTPTPTANPANAVPAQ